MARYDGRATPGYAPVLRLDMRLAPEGGDLRIPLRPVWQAHALRQNELLVLVHGFNNHQGEAEAAYQGLRVRQRGKLGAATTPATFEQSLGDAFWPGDAAWPGLVDKVDFLVYPHAVSVARDAAPVLDDYLRARAGDVLVVHFLAHSLGCRLALETIRRLAVRGAPRIGNVCLMAAAVPTFKTCPGGELFDALNAARSLRVLFSPADPVLHWAFPPGQTLASGDEGFLPTAVGRHGDVPVQPGSIVSEEIIGAGHGDYWGHNPGAASDRSADSIARFFRFDDWAARQLPTRQLSTGAPPARRAAGPKRPIADR